MKDRFNKIITITLCFAMLMGSVNTIFAEMPSKSIGIAPIALDTQPIIFNVTVPSGLPVDIDAQGEVTVATNVKIENNSAAPITITGIQVKPIIDWSIVPMNKDFKDIRIGTKEFGFVLNSDEVPTSGTVALTKSNWPSINGGSNLPLTYDSIIAPQRDAIEDSKIADVVFTIGWDVNEIPEVPISIGTKYIEGNYEYSYKQEMDFNTSDWANSSLDGWGVRVLDKSQTSYLQPLETIQGKPVVSYSLLFAFYSNSTLTLEGNWTNKNISNMFAMFLGSKATTALDLSKFNTSNVTDMKNMFDNCKATSLDISGFNTSKVTNMWGMFNSTRTTTLDVSNFNTSNVTNMGGMFNDCSATNIIGLNSFKTSNVTIMQIMFSNSSATSLDLSSFDASKVSDTYDMFKDSQATTGYARTQIEADKFNASSNKPSSLTFIVKPA